MKKLFGFFAITLLSTLAFAQTNPQPISPVVTTPPPAVATPPAEVEDNTPKTTIEFNELEFDFGTIKQGEKAEHTFKFKNTGKNPLVINSAKGSCGCTVPTWPKEPVQPGATGEVHVVFNSAGKSGAQVKPVTIMANTDPNPSRITMKGTVELPANAATPTTPPHAPAVTPPAAPQNGKAGTGATIGVNAKSAETPSKATAKAAKKPAPTAPAPEVSNKEAAKAAKAAKKAADKAAKAAKKAADKAAKEAKKAADKAANAAKASVK